VADKSFCCLGLEPQLALDVTRFIGLGEFHSVRDNNDNWFSVKAGPDKSGHYKRRGALARRAGVTFPTMQSCRSGRRRAWCF
jgi:hypothetical protein